MDRLYRGFEGALLGLALCLGAVCLGLAACAASGTRPPEDTLAVSLPMLTVTVPPAR